MLGTLHAYQYGKSFHCTRRHDLLSNGCGLACALKLARKLQTQGYSGVEAMQAMFHDFASHRLLDTTEHHAGESAVESNLKSQQGTIKEVSTKLNCQASSHTVMQG